MTSGTTSLPRSKKSRARVAASMLEVLAHPSPGTIAITFAGVLIVALCALLVYLLSNTIVLFLLGVFVATIIDPSVQALRRWGVPVRVGILLHYIVFFAITLLLVLSLLPIIAEQITGLATLSTSGVNRFLVHPVISVPFLRPETNAHLSQLVRTALEHESIQKAPDALLKIGQYLSTASSLEFATDIVGSVFSFLLDTTIVLLFAFFLEAERDVVLRWFCNLFPQRFQPYLLSRAGMVRSKLGQWVKGQLVLCLVIAVLAFIALVSLGMPYALTLALLAGFTEFIPYVGPLIAAIPPILIALAERGFTWALIIAAVYYLIQWTENNVIVPLIMKHAVDVSAVAIMVAMLVGVSFPSVIHPVLGILLSIPVTSIIALFLDDLRYKKDAPVAA